jgi:predicted RNase H-like HicB family nuclease
MPRKKLAHPLKLSVVFEPDEGGWHVHVPSLQGCRTWGRSLTEARRNIREAISLQEEAFDDADAVARDALLEEDIQLPADARALLEKAEAAKAQAEAEATKAKAFSVAAARRLAAFTSLRDAGELLHLSQEGVRKLVKTPDAVVVLQDALEREGVSVMSDTRVLEGLEVDGRGFRKVTVSDSRYPKAARTKDIKPVPVSSSRPPSRSRRSRAAYSGKGS